MHISQSGVSAQIRQLERELGAELFDRSARTATLTVAGKAALEHARAALAAGRGGRPGGGRGDRPDPGPAHGRDGHRLHRSRRCSTPSPRSTGRIPVWRSRCWRTTPTGSSKACAPAPIDLALVGTATATPDGLDALTIISERLVAAVPAGHPLAKRRQVTLRDLDAYPIVCMPPGTGLRTVFDQACAAQRPPSRTIALQASAADAIADLAARGLGVAILSDSMAAADDDRLKRLLVADVQTPAVLAVIWTKTKSPALRALLLHVHDAFTVA